MAGITRYDVERVYSKIREGFIELDGEERMFVLRKLERKANTYNGELISEEMALHFAFEKIKYNVARIYAEGKAISTLAVAKKYLDTMESCLEYISNVQKNEREILLLKELITHTEIALNLDISFHTSLENIYRYSLEKERVYFQDVVSKYRGGMIVQ